MGTNGSAKALVFKIDGSQLFVDLLAQTLARASARVPSPNGHDQSEAKPDPYLRVVLNISTATNEQALGFWEALLRCGFNGEITAAADPTVDPSNREPTRRNRLASLNARDRRVLNYLLEGFRNKEIANRMNLSESAVKRSFQHLFQAFQVRSRSEVVRAVFENPNFGDTRSGRIERSVDSIECLP